jgi:hypothetical protein
MKSPPKRPRQNNIVQTSVSIRRVKKPAVLNANADSTTRVTPRQLWFLSFLMARTLGRVDSYLIQSTAAAMVTTAR